MQASHPPFPHLVRLSDLNRTTTRIPEPPVSFESSGTRQPTLHSSVSLSIKRPVQSLEPIVSPYMPKMKKQKIFQEPSVENSTSRLAASQSFATSRVPQAPDPKLVLTPAVFHAPIPTPHRTVCASPKRPFSGMGPLTPKPSYSMAHFALQQLSSVLKSSRTAQDENKYQATFSTGKRFKPLVLKAASPPSYSISIVNPPIPNVSGTVFGQNESSNASAACHLDFPQTVSDTLVFSPITWPPKLSLRKQVYRWSVILSGLSNEERRQCKLVSRMFRYSGKSYHHEAEFFYKDVF